LQKEYWEKDTKVKKSARNTGNKTKFVKERAEEAEKAAIRGDFNTVYKITKELSGKARYHQLKMKRGKP
jgi:hypothetical protein